MAGRLSRLSAALCVGVLVAGAWGCAKPRVQLQVSRDQIQQGEDVRVSWESKNAKAVSINGETVDQVGSRVYTPDNTTTYTALATRGKREARDSKIVGVSPRPPRPNISISSDQDAIERGQSTTLRWTSTNAERVEISELGAVPPSGSRTVSPGQSTTFTATATGRGGSDTASTRVTVTEPAVAEGERPRTTTNPTIAALFNQWVQPVFFDYDRSEITPEGRDRLRRAAGWLTQSPNRTIVFRIEGHCDPRGSEEYNIGLGERRAQAAREFFISLGVEPDRIMTVSYGKERANGSYEGPPVPGSWAFDRRDDFIYVSGGTPPGNPEPMLMVLEFRELE